MRLYGADITGSLQTTGSISLSGSFKDQENSPGTAGQVLSSTVSGSQWVDVGGSGIGDVTKTGTIVANQIAIWNNTTNQLRSDPTFVIDSNYKITLYQPNSSNNDRSSYNIGGGNIDNVTGQFNTGFGKNNLTSIVAGSQNIAIGANALSTNTDGDFNIAVGYNSLLSLTTGYSNTAYGNQTLQANTYASQNSAFGANALILNVSGASNTALGYLSLGANTSGPNNVAVGALALRNSTGTTNTAIGHSAGSAITTGDKNVIIGSNTGSTIATSDNNIIISDGDGNNRIQVDSDGDVGIGTNSPEELLDVYTEGADPTSILQIRANRTGYGSIRTNLKTYSGGSSATNKFTINFEGTDALTISSGGTTSINTDGATQLILHREDSSIFLNNTIGTIQVTADDPTANQLGAQIQFLGGGTWGTNDYPTDIVFSNDNSGTLTERMRITSTGDVLAANASTGGNLYVGRNGGNGSTAASQQELFLRAYSLYQTSDATYYGSYGFIQFNADNGWTSGARKFAITNGYLGTNFAILRSTSAREDIVLDGNGGATSTSIVDFTIGNTGLATFFTPLKVSNASAQITLNDANSDSSGSSNEFVMTDYNNNEIFRISKIANTLDTEIANVLNGNLLFRTNNTVRLTISLDGVATFIKPWGSNLPVLKAGNTANGIASSTYDTAVIQADDVTSIRIREINPTTTNQEMGFSVGDNNASITSTENLRFYTGGTPGNFIYNGMGGTQALTIATGGDVTVNAGKLFVSNGNIIGGSATDVTGTHYFNKGASVNGGILYAGSSTTGRFSLVVQASDMAYNNTPDTCLKIGGTSSTSRSISAAGTVNVSGNDYAEYMTKAITDDISKGDVVGVNSDGLLTNIFSNAISFVIKSTDPSFVGGDIWGIESKDEDEIEEARIKVDRIAFSGQVPCNVTGASVGDYIIPVASSDGKITGEAVSDPTFEQYKISVGKIWKIMEDGRSWVAVKIG